MNEAKIISFFINVWRCAETARRTSHTFAVVSMSSVCARLQNVSYFIVKYCHRVKCAQWLLTYFIFLKWSRARARIDILFANAILYLHTHTHTQTSNDPCSKSQQLANAPTIEAATNYFCCYFFSFTVVTHRHHLFIIFVGDFRARQLSFDIVMLTVWICLHRTMLMLIV